MFARAGYELAPIEYDLKLSMLNKQATDLVTLPEILSTEHFVSDEITHTLSENAAENELSLSGIFREQVTPRKTTTKCQPESDLASTHATASPSKTKGKLDFSVNHPSNQNHVKQSLLGMLGSSLQYLREALIGAEFSDDD